MRLRDGFRLDPYRACVGLAAAAKARRALFYEKTTAARVRFFTRHVEVTTGKGIVRAGTVIVATGTAGAEFKPLRRHFRRREAYVVMTEPVPAPVRKQMTEASHVLRTLPEAPTTIGWTIEDRLVVTGAAQDETPARTRSAVLVQRTGQLMYELLRMYPAISGLKPEYGWEASYGQTMDGLMYIGAHRNYPRHLFALGGVPDSATGAFVAARILTRALQGAPEKADAVFGWTR
jgi:glycine/D-amino acid oxidase-like deaminating enzyme